MDAAPLGSVSDIGAITLPEAAGASSGAQAGADVQAVAISDEFDLNDEANDGEDRAADSEAVQAELQAAAAGFEAKEELPTAYLCSVSQRGRFRRLHYAGACWRRPGIHFLAWEDLGLEPDLTHIDARCSDCFPAGRPDARQEEAAAVSDEDAAS